MATMRLERMLHPPGRHMRRKAAGSGLAGQTATCHTRLAHRGRRLGWQALAAVAAQDDGSPSAASAPPHPGQQGQPSTSTRPENTEPSAPPSPPGPPDQQKPLLLRLLAFLKPPEWLTTIAARLAQRDEHTLRLLRMAFIAALFVTVACMRQMLDSRVQVKTQEVMYSDFVTLLDRDRVRAVRLESGTGRLYFDIKAKESTAPELAAAASTAQPAAAADASAVASSSGTTLASAATTATTTAGSTQGLSGSPTRFSRQFMVKLADKNDFLLTSKILQAGVEFAVFQKGAAAVMANMFLTTLAVWIPLLPLFFLLRRIMEDRTSAGRKKKSDGKPQQPSITFRDVAGVESAKEELMEVVTVMRGAQAAYNKLNVKMPSGVLLCGPPGTGKTLLAKAVAGEAGVPFFAFSASEFVELYVGRGAARIREVFAEARKAAPCVVFIDELDAVGARRGMGYNDERDQTLNQLLTELDGFEGRQGILFLAATNRIEILDPALLRPGRINRKINVPLPDEAGRRQILGVHLRGVPMGSVEEKAEACDRLARVTPGFSGAELANVVNEATLLAARHDLDRVGLRELLEGVQRTKNGVNGGSGVSLATGLSRWLMDLAVGPDTRRVKNAAVS